MRNSFTVFLLAFALALPLAWAGPFDTNLSLDLPTQNNDIPNPQVIAQLKERFDEARMPLSVGDLHLRGRWNCREFFTEATGYTSFRFKSYSFVPYEGTILEDTLNNSPRFYVFGRTELTGASSSLAGVRNEVRIDHEGNLRIATQDATHVKSYVVCLRKNLQL